jgi:phenylacetate-CoA ligase
MNGAALRLYHKLPIPFKTLAATMRGMKLRNIRFGPETERLVAEALERESWTADDWGIWQAGKLEQLLHRASRDVPHYREVGQNIRAMGHDVRNLRSWPILDKEALREDPRRFIAEDRVYSELIHEHTSGTTGTSIHVSYSKQTARAWYAIFEARWRRWYGVSRHDRWAHIGGQLVTPVESRNPPFWVWNAALNQLYMSAYHLAPDLIPHYLEALRRYKVVYIWGYSSALYALAECALESNVKDLHFKVVVSNAEPLEDYQRQAIADAFRCPVRATYGMSEMVAAASECENGRMHLWPEVGIVEVTESEKSVGEGVAGDFICTGLLNVDMPLIRYRLGDRGALAPAEEKCSCGRRLPLLASVEGRSDDVLFTADGRRIGRLDPVFKTGIPVREAQIIQEEFGRIRLVYVPASGFDDATGDLLVRRIRDRLGPVRVDLQPVSEIPRTANGKFRAVICTIPKEQRKRSKELVQ